MLCVLDLETQTKKWYGAVASPFHPENYIVAPAWCTDSGAIKYRYFESKEESDSSDWLDEALEGNKVLVAHNATFELHWLLHRYPKTLLNWLKNGGLIYCTQYAEYLLSGQINMYPSLDEVAPNYGGTHKVDEVKALWSQGVETSDIDRDTLLDYLASPEHGDIANTRKTAIGQIKLLKERGMMQMFWMRMDALLFNAIATFNGLYVNMDVAKKQQAESEAEVARLQEVVKSQMPKLPEDFEFSFSSGYHLSALLYGGIVQYKAKVPYDPPKYEQIECYAYKALHDGCGELHYVPTCDVHPVYETDAYEPVVFKAGKNKGQLKVFKIDSDVEKLKWGDNTFKFNGLIKLASMPTHIKKLFLGNNAEYAGKNTLIDGTPVYSTKDEVLDMLARYSDACKPISSLRALGKDLGTYYISVDDNANESGMLKFVEPSGVIHHQLNNCATITGRLSSSKPNLQNIPRADLDDNGNAKSLVKRMFESRFGSDGYITEVDYSALEVVGGASISGDTNLLHQLAIGTDMHCLRLAKALVEPYEDVKRKCKDETHPEHDKYKLLRIKIKPRSFAKQYGASAEGIAYQTGDTVEEAQKFIDVENELFPQFSTFAERVVRPEVEATGKQSPLEREYADGQWGMFRRGYFTSKGGTRYSYRQVRQWVKGVGYVYDYKSTQLANYWCQGECAFIVQAACGRVIRHLIANDFYDGKCLPINTVHDAIYTDSSNEAVAKESALTIKSLMETTPAWIAERIPAYKDWNYHTTPFPAEAEIGHNMMDKHHV